MLTLTVKKRPINFAFGPNKVLSSTYVPLTLSENYAVEVPIRYQ